MEENRLAEFQRLLKEEIPFTFARYGDGEWKAILQTKGHNCDGHKYFPAMGQELSRVVKSAPSYYMGMQDLAMKILGDEITEFLNGTDIDWINADVFHRASINEEFEVFFELFDAAPIIFVGPQHLRGMDRFFSIQHYVEVPSKDCWLQGDSIQSQIINLLKSEKYYVVLFSASMAANVWIDNLHARFGSQASFLDMGSVFDPYAGVRSRSYHAKILERIA